MVALLISVPLYPFFLRSMEAAAERKRTARRTGRMTGPGYPSLYQINTRVWLTNLSRSLGRPATLDDVPDAELDRVAAMELDWVWLLSVWQTGPASRQVSLTSPTWREEFENTLPDLTDADIAGSGFAITGYRAHPDLGGEPALARMRERLRSRGLRLMLDFVPNHTGLDHPWVEEHPEYYVAGSELDLVRSPGNYRRIKARGRRSHPGPWPGPLLPRLARHAPARLRQAATREAMLAELMTVAAQCDGVRCDMAMLILPDVFQRTWGIWAEPFWPRATQAVRERFPGFLLHGRGLLGPRVGAAAAGLRLHLRQAAVRSAPRRPGPAGTGPPQGRDSTIRAGSPASWRTTTSRGPLPLSRRRFTRRPPSSPSSRPGCAFFTRGNSRGGGSGSRLTCVAAPDEAVDQRLTVSIAGCSMCSAGPWCARAAGSWSRARPPGKETGAGIASWRSPGREQAASDCSWR